MLNVKYFALPFLLILFLLPTLFVKLIDIFRFDSHVRPVCPSQSFATNCNFKYNCNVRYDKPFLVHVFVVNTFIFYGSLHSTD